MRRSMVVGQGGSGVVDDIRTSFGMFIKRFQDPIVERVERRISMATRLPVAHQEEIQVLRYTKGQKYSAHYDSAYGSEGTGPHERLATFYMYLSDVEEGGETAFPKDSEWADAKMGAAADPTFSECAKGHVAAHAKAGDAVLFYSFFPNKTMDPASMHTGCPVIKGIKWGAPVWIHIDEFKPDEAPSMLSHAPEHAQPYEPGRCEDLDTRCSGWAGSGECQHNPGYMVDGVGACRASCGACTTCGEADWGCIRENRAKGGYLDVQREEMEWLGVDWWMD
mmetsp:Transcript_14846/g.43598  ORF Transcript_14846/g.43598 Transcript_14846/m.43598 type:complete len:279 (+) Transcript_14846:1195-2031(+)